MRELEFYQACPICDDARIVERRTDNCTRHQLYKPQLSGEIVWLGCEACGHVFRNGYYTPEACAILFADTQESQVVGHDFERQRVVSARMIEQVLPWRAKGHWLDVGFGNGSLLFTALEYGFHPVGLDLRADNVERMKRHGVEAYCADLLAVEAKAAISVISMCDVLEHMPFPVPALRHSHALLEPGGVLYLSMPNREAPVWLMLDGRGQNPYWAEIEHYHNFGRTGLQALLRANGFEPLRYAISERYRAGMELVAIKPA